MRVGLAAEEDIPAEGTKCVEVHGRKYALFKVSGQVYCLDNTCSHLGGPLCEGRLAGFVVNLGVVHITEQDCQGLSEIFASVNRAWRTQMTFCIYPSKEKARDMVLNVRGSPKAPAEID